MTSDASFASALPVSYSAEAAEDWEPFTRLVLGAAYEATLAVAARRCATTPGGRVAVFLTALGGGAFGNDFEWIRDAIEEALDKFDGWPLDVALVHYARCDESWVHALPPRQGSA
jgi:hypothetical protein